MAFFVDTFCQLCERFITKERWKKHLYSSRFLLREVNGYWPAFVPQEKLIADEGSVHEKAFCEMNFESVDVLPVWGFLKTKLKLVTKMKNYLTLVVSDDDADFRYNYRDTMIAQFNKQLCNKSFSLQDQDESDENDPLQKRTNLWLNGIDMGFQNLIKFMIMIVSTLEWIILFVRRDIFLRLGN